MYRLTARGVEMFVEHQWINVPNERIQYRALAGDTGETFGGHWCGSLYQPAVTQQEAILHMTKCAILPPQAASAQ